MELGERHQSFAGMSEEAQLVAHYRSQLEAVFNNASVALFLTDERQHCTYLNPAAENLTGFTMDEVRGRPLHFVFHHTHPDGSFYQVEECPLARASLQNYPEQGEEIFVRRDGSFFPGSYSVSPIRNEIGVVGTVVEVVDISERKRAEEELRLREERFRTLTTTHAEVVWVADREGRLREAPEWEDFTGQRLDEALDWGWLSCVHPDDRVKIRGAWTQIIQNKTPAEFEVRFLDRRGSYRLGQVKVAPLLDEHGEVREWIGSITDVQELTEVQDALRDANIVSEMALSAGGVVAWVWDIPRNRFKGNESFAGVFSVDPEVVSAEGLPLERIVEAIHEDDRSRVLEAIARARRTGQSYAEDFRVRTKNGDVRWLAGRGYVEYDASGNPVRLPGVLVDVTELKQAEQSARESQARLRFTLDAAEIGSWELDLAGNCLSRSLQHDKIFGYETPPPEWSYETFLNEHVHPEDRAYVDERFQRSMKSQMDWEFVCRIIRVDEEVRWIWAKGTFEFTPNGNPNRMLGLVKDITSTKRGEEALRKSEERYRTLFNSIDEGLCTVEVMLDADDQPVDFRFLEVNASFVSQCGLGDVLGKTMRQVVPGLEETWFSAYGRVALTGEPIRFEGHAKALGRWFDVYAFRNRHPSSRQVGILFKDVTERREKEEALAKARSDLEERVRERTAELEALNTELDSFNYSVSHDLRSPLRGIKGFTKAVIEDYGDQLDATAVQYLDRVRAGADRMNELIEDLLNLSRLSRSRIKRQHVDLSALAEIVLNDLRAEDPERQVELRIQEGVTAEADEGLLRIALRNLLENAWKFTRERSDACIEFGADESDGEVVLFVKDNGTGFDMQFADRVFVPFQRLHSATDFSGTGIGLAIVQRIIRRHGGRIKVKAELGSGAAFYFTLPDAKKGSPE